MVLTQLLVHGRSKEVQLAILYIYKSRFSLDQKCSCSTWMQDGKKTASPVRDPLVPLTPRLTWPLVLRSPLWGPQALGQTPKCARHWGQWEPWPFLFLLLSQMKLIPHQLYMIRTTSVAGSDDTSTPQTALIGRSFEELKSTPVVMSAVTGKKMNYLSF